MIQANADIVAGDSGGPLAGPGGVIGMDTAGNDAGSEQQTVGFAIPVNTALSVASQIAAGRASSAVAIGYPPFLGIFVGTGSDSSPQDQAQQGQQQYGSGGSQGCSASNAGLTGGAVITVISGQAVGSMQRCPSANELDPGVRECPLRSSGIAVPRQPQQSWGAAILREEPLLHRAPRFANAACLASLP